MWIHSFVVPAVSLPAIGTFPRFPHFTCLTASDVRSGVCTVGHLSRFFCSPFRVLKNPLLKFFSKTIRVFFLLLSSLFIYYRCARSSSLPRAPSVSLHMRPSVSCFSPETSCLSSLFSQPLSGVVSCTEGISLHSSAHRDRVFSSRRPHALFSFFSLGFVGLLFLLYSSLLFFYVPLHPQYPPLAPSFSRSKASPGHRRWTGSS